MSWLYHAIIIMLYNVISTINHRIQPLFLGNLAILGPILYLLIPSSSSPLPTKKRAGRAPRANTTWGRSEKVEAFGGCWSLVNKHYYWTWPLTCCEFSNGKNVIFHSCVRLPEGIVQYSCAVAVVSQPLKVEIQQLYPLCCTHYIHMIFHVFLQSPVLPSGNQPHGLLENGP